MSKKTRSFLLPSLPAFVNDEQGWCYDLRLSNVCVVMLDAMLRKKDNTRIGLICMFENIYEASYRTEFGAEHRPIILTVYVW